LGQLLVVKERKGSRMAMGKRGPKQNAGKRVRGERKKGGDKKKPLERKGASCVFTKVICK
jgi:hypothetical protein